MPAAASAQTPSPFAFRAELGVGGMINDFTPSDDRGAVAGTAAVRFAWNPVEALSIQLSGMVGRFFPSGADHVGNFSATLGLRLEPWIGRAGRLWLDVNGGVYGPGREDVPGLDGGLGFEFRLSDEVQLGPFARYTRAFDGLRLYESLTAAQIAAGQQSRQVGSADIDYWVAGISLTYRVMDAPPPPPPPPPVVDTDHDGVNDPDDQCVSEPQGEHPDANRRGCPTPDTDGDGVLDPDDQCRETAAGEHPDPERAGCPDGDDDSDGVLNHADQCRTEAAGEHPNPERAGCPDGDQDHDEVTDHADQCPTEPAGFHADPARPGCPAPDQDHDNVPDAEDACPTRPGAPSTVRARNGCPGLVTLTGDQIRIARPVFFANNRDVILPASNAVLDAVAEVLRAVPGIRRLSVEGHTDDVGDDAANLDLSRRRAQSVVTALTRRGIDAARLVSEGFGETRPLVTGTTRTARAQNRRVEFRVAEFHGMAGDPVPPGAAAAPPAAPAAPTP
ncbi:MAG: OmpA family protein [Polyangiales bacterium]